MMFPLRKRIGSITGLLGGAPTIIPGFRSWAFEPRRTCGSDAPLMREHFRYLLEVTSRLMAVTARGIESPCHPMLDASVTGSKSRKNRKLPMKGSKMSMRGANEVSPHVCTQGCKHDAHFEAVAIDGVRIPDSRMAKDLMQLVRDSETDLLFNHSTRVYFRSE